VAVIEPGPFATDLTSDSSMKQATWMAEYELVRQQLATMLTPEMIALRQQRQTRPSRPWTLTSRLRGLGSTTHCNPERPQRSYIFLRDHYAKIRRQETYPRNQLVEQKGNRSPVFLGAWRIPLSCLCSKVSALRTEENPMKKYALILALAVLAASPSFADDMPVNANVPHMGAGAAGAAEGRSDRRVIGRPLKSRTAEYVTVISGKFHIGMGEKLDEKKGVELRAGGFGAAPAHMNHYA
jgi:hypothetical protein